MAKPFSQLVPLTGTEKKPVAGARHLGRVNRRRRITVTVLLRRRTPLGTPHSRYETLLNAPIAQRQYFSREELSHAHGANAADMNRIDAFASEHELTVVHRSAAERRMVLSGTLAALTRAFGVQLKRVSSQGRQYRMRTGPIYVPKSLVDIVEDVKGFDNRRQARAHFRRLTPKVTASKRAKRAAKSKSATFTPLEISNLYNFPTGTNGAGECIALIELGGGYRTSDLKTYFRTLGIPIPSIVAVSVDGGSNDPGGDADAEVMLDIEVAGAIAPGAKIVVYFAPNTDQGFLDAIKTAVHDTTHNPSVISISWGGPEGSYTPQALKNYSAVFEDAAALGVTILAASGDNGSADVDPPDKKKRVDFPAASPFVLACGGTSLKANKAKTAVVAEQVWNDGAAGGASGGGVSTKFSLPTWQKTADVPTAKSKAGRGVPDVAGNADPQTGYRVRVDGQTEIIGGTSAVAPLWAGFVARCNQQLGKSAGFVNALVYTDAAKQGFHDILVGNNVGYEAKTGWDACTGLGTPDGKKLLNALQQ